MSNTYIVYNSMLVKHEFLAFFTFPFAFKEESFIIPLEM